MKKSIVGFIALTAIATISSADVCETVAISVSSGESANTSSTGGNGTSGNNTPENSTDPNIAIQQLLIKEQGSTYAHHIDKTIFS